MKGWLWAVPAVLGIVLLVVFRAGSAERRPRAVSSPLLAAASTAERAPELTPPQPADVFEPAATNAPSTPSERRALSAPGTAVLNVRVIGHDKGEPLAKVTVELARLQQRKPPARPAWGRYGPAYSTGANGTLALEAPADELLWMRASDPDRSTQVPMQRIEPLSDGEHREVVFELAIEVTHYFGRVLDRERGLPIAEAQVVPEDGPHRVSPVESDEGGFFEVVVPPSSERKGFTLQAASYGLVRGHFEPGHDQPSAAQIFRMTRAGTLDGRVMDANGKPLAGLPVVATTEADELEQPWPMEVEHQPGTHPAWAQVTDEDGHFHLADLPARVELLVEVQNTPQRAPEQRELVLAAGELRTFDIVLPATVALRGLVLDERGQAAPDLVLWIDRARSPVPGYFADEGGVLAALKTDPDGRFEVACAPSGVWRIGPAPGGGFAPLWSVIEIPPAPAEQELVVHVDSGLDVSGRVVLQDGAPAADATLSIRCNWCEPPPGDRSGRDGSFVLGPLVRGEYLLRAERAPGCLDSAEVRVRAGDEGVLLSLPPSAGSLRGRVLFGDIPRGTTTITAFRRGDPGFESRLLGDEEEFIFQDLAPGLYDLVAETNRGGWGELRGLAPAQDGGDPVTIELQPAASLRVLYVGDAERAELLVQGAGIPVSRVGLRRGRSAILQVPPGVLVLQSSSPGSPISTRRVEVIAGEEVEVLLP